MDDSQCVAIGPTKSKPVCQDRRTEEKDEVSLGIFQGKSAIVTGGASGIGRALGEELGRRGAIVILADLNEALLEETVSSLAGKGYRVEGATLDVTDFAAVKELVDGTISRHGRLDYMFNNAGIDMLGEALDMSLDDWMRVIDVNLYGVVHGVAAAYPVMVEQGYGHIVNTSSLAGFFPVTGEISYTTSKYGVLGLSEVLRIEGEKYGVKVSVVCPGIIRTPIYENCEVVGFDREKVMALSPKGISPQRCAKIVLKGVERNRGIIPVTALAYAAWWLGRFAPRISRAINRRMLEAFRATRMV
jgi:NAD(P)-dependent dehydrogenase (short-subunit alcohol dehydrogenase family)